MNNPSVPSSEIDHDVCCPMCGYEIEGSTRSCNVCRTPHHLECWNKGPGCAIFACKGRIDRPISRRMRNTTSVPIPGQRQGVPIRGAAPPIFASRPSRNQHTIHQIWGNLCILAFLGGGCAWAGEISRVDTLVTAGASGLVAVWIAAYLASAVVPEFSPIREFDQNWLSSPLLISTTALAFLAMARAYVMPAAQWTPVSHSFVILVTVWIGATVVIDPGTRKGGTPARNYLILCVLFALSTAMLLHGDRA